MSQRKLRLKSSTPTDIRKSIARVNNMVLNDELDPKQANAIIYGFNTVLGAIRVDEQQKKLDELERLVMEKEKRK